MTERENKLRAYPVVNSSIVHRGIPSKAAPSCFVHALHRMGFGEDAWMGQMFDFLDIVGARSTESVLTNAHTGE